MAALAYLLLPLTGLLAYFTGGSARVRFHGLQAIAWGLIWALVLYACAAVSARVTRVAFVAGTVVWLGLLVGAALGREPTLPWLGPRLRRAAEQAPTYR